MTRWSWLAVGLLVALCATCMLLVVGALILLPPEVPILGPGVSTTPQPHPSNTPTLRPSAIPQAATPIPISLHPLSLIASRGHRSEGGNYFIVEGQIKNISAQALSDVLAVATVYDASHQFITYDDALVDFTTLLPGQVSPFSVMIDYNPAIEYYQIEFASLLGDPIPHSDDRPEATTDGAYLSCAKAMLGILDEIFPTLEEQVDFAIQDPGAGEIICSFMPVWFGAIDVASEDYARCEEPEDATLGEARTAIANCLVSLNSVFTYIGDYCGVIDLPGDNLSLAKISLTDASFQWADAWQHISDYENAQ